MCHVAVAGYKVSCRGIQRLLFSCFTSFQLTCRMALFDKFKQFIQDEKLFQPNDRLLVAVSGGIDSVVLCELCRQAGYHFEMAHCNFKLRGEESDRDELFVRALAGRMGVVLHSKSFDTTFYAKTNRQSIEEAAREIRYQWFHELLSRPEALPMQCIVTGHHADDNMETVMMNFFRGTGISGLRGILPKQGKVVRPLLFARRSELEFFLKDNGLEFVTDHTNLLTDYTRNFFRNKVVPLVKECYPEAGENLLRNIHRFRETEILYRQSIELHKRKLLEIKGSETHIPVLKLQQAIPLASIVYEIINPFGFTAHQVDEVIGLLSSETGKYVKSASHRIIRNRNWLVIAPNQTMEASTILIEKSDTTISFGAGQVQIKHLPNTGQPLSTGNEMALLNASAITFPLLLRRWKQGDYFYPLGMQKKKKLNRFLTDQKLSMVEKENTWVIEMDKKIVWVVGKRIDDRFKVTPATRHILKINYLPRSK